MFDVGDRVICIDNTNSEYELHLNETYIVKQYLKTNNGNYVLTNSTNEIEVFFKTFRFKNIKETFNNEE